MAGSTTDDCTVPGGPGNRNTIAAFGCIVGGCALIPFDATLFDAVRALPMGTDLERELMTLGQFGQFGSVVLIGALIWMLDPERVRRLLDWGAGALLVWVTVMTLKLSLGRVRPRLVEDAGRFLWPWGTAPLGDGPPVHAWDIVRAQNADLWSMPSNHTAFAVLMAVFLASLYPRLRWFGFALACVVGCARVRAGAHYFSDVLVGAGIALAIATHAIRGYWGVRALDWIWVRAVDRSATPAYPALAARERGSRRARGAPPDRG